MHWYQSSSCDFPELTPKQQEIITGVLMGDGTISTPGANPLLSVVMITEEYLNYVDDKLGKYGKETPKDLSTPSPYTSNKE